MRTKNDICVVLRAVPQRLLRKKNPSIMLLYSTVASCCCVMLVILLDVVYFLCVSVRKNKLGTMHTVPDNQTSISLDVVFI